MEFDEMKKIWDSQNNEPFYGINEKALHNRILSKGKQGHHITNITELLFIIGNTATGCFVLAANVFKQSGSISMYFSSAWMLGTALYVLASRIRRIRRDHHFDRSMRGDLNHAISTASYQVRLSQLGRWSILPVGILTILGIVEGGKSVWIIIGLLIFLVLANFAAGWEHNIYKKRKRELEVLQTKLEKEEPGEPPTK